MVSEAERRESGLPVLLLTLLVDLAYLVALVVLTPWLLYLIFVRRRRVGSLRERLGGIAMPAARAGRVWLHAVSVGELEAALPLIRELEACGLEVVVTTTTASARELAERRLPGRRVCYFPLDFGFCVRRSLARIRPDVIVLVELELWPNLILVAARRGVPVTVVNGRITQRSVRRLRWVRRLVAPLLARVARIEVQDEVYRGRLLALGAPEARVTVTGNLKFDGAQIHDPAAVRGAFEARYSLAADAPRWIAGSTHDGEEAALLDAHRTLAAEMPSLFLVLAPRHVERAGEVARSVAARGLRGALHSEYGGGRPPEVVIIDVTGELARLYAVADVAFVGGSLIPRGGHNLLEPVLAGTPVLHGPHTENFREMAGTLDDAGAAERVSDASVLTQRLRQWLTDRAERGQRVAAGQAVIERHRGVARRAANMIADVVRSTSRPARATIPPHKSTTTS